MGILSNTVIIITLLFLVIITMEGERPRNLKNRICLCVARYNEDLSWLKNIENDVQIKLYNKGETNNLTNYYNATNLDNVGREAHTYLYYIIENYDNLPEYTIFLQGNPFDHSPNFYKTLKDVLTDNKKILFKYFSEFEDRFFISDRDFPIEKIYNEIFKINVKDKTNLKDKEFRYGTGAQFLVHKTLILQHDVSFYKECIKHLYEDIKDIKYKHIEWHGKEIEYINAHVFERLWKLIFLGA
tara:strand:+ start:97 stop:822 length:726 start_codon:yes stop_codon:yes gene_type:complete